MWFRDSRQPGSTEWFLEEQAFSPSYDMASAPPHISFSKLYLFLGLPVCPLLEAKSYGGEKLRKPAPL